MKENHKYLIIKKLVETNGNKTAAALRLNCTVRTIDRLITKYKTKGKEAFVHGNKNRKPINAIPDDLKTTIIDLYITKYEGANFKHFCELLHKYEAIEVSYTTIKNIFDGALIVSPKATRKMKKRVKKTLLEKKKKKNISFKEKASLSKKIVAIEDAHPRKPRAKYKGELIQMDASQHVWFGNKKTYLHAAIDDCTGEIIGAYFDSQETLNGYYNVFSQILTDYGIPFMFFTDRRTIFEFKHLDQPIIEKDTFTQFSYACHQLGVKIETSSIPQAKGRIERLFETLQSRLPIELKLAGITEIEQANEFLKSYLKEFNSQFALVVKHTRTAYKEQPTAEKINLTLAVLTKRTIDTGHCIRFNNKFYRPIDNRSQYVNYYKGTEALVIHSFDKKLFVTINESIYALEEIPEHKKSSKNFDLITEHKTPKEKYIPPMNHPWKSSAFYNFVQKQLREFSA
jgi:nitrogen regulatory protein PII-like uncharacterized protein